MGTIILIIAFVIEIGCAAIRVVRWRMRSFIVIRLSI